MEDFWQTPNRKRYLFNDIYNINTTILRFHNWFVIEHEVNLTRTYYFITPSGDGNYEQETISEEDYLRNQEDGNYLNYVNYQDLTDNPDYNSLSKEFETIIKDSFIYEEQNLFLEFALKSIDKAPSNGKAKSLLKSILQTLKACSKKQTKLLTNGSLNRLQEIIVEAYSYSYGETARNLVKHYDDVYGQITKPFKEAKLEMKQAKLSKQEKHSQIFAGNAFYLWERLREHFQLDDSSRADFRFMYDAMKHDSYIHKTVKQTDMLNWVNDTYEIAIGKPRFNAFKTDAKRMSVYNMIKLQYQELDK